MKKVTLASLGCIAALGFVSACSNEPKSRKEGGTLPKPYVETLPNILETATKADGGMIVGKKPNEIEVSSTVDPNAPIYGTIDIKNRRIAGIGMDQSVQDIIAKLGKPRLLDDADDLLYYFESAGIFVGIKKAAPNGLADTPDYILSSAWMGYKGKILGTDSYGSVAMNKPIRNGEISTDVARVEFLRNLGAHVAARSDSTEPYDCFLEATCTFARQASGDYALVFPHALVVLTAEGSIKTIEFDKTARTLKPELAPTESLQYGKNFAGISLGSTAKEIQAVWGKPEIAEGREYYQNRTASITRDAQGNIKTFSVNQDFQGYVRDGKGEISGIQLGDPVEIQDFSCEAAMPLILKTFDEKANPDLTACIVKDNLMLAVLPGATLTFELAPSAANNAAPATKKMALMNYGLKLRPVIYGDSIGGLKKGMSLADLGAVYGNYSDAKALNEETYELTYTDGLSVIFDNVKGEVTSVQATAKYKVPVYDASLSTVALELGRKSSINFANNEAARFGLHKVAKQLEGGLQEILRKQAEEAAIANAAHATTPAAAPKPEDPTFDAITQCSLIRESTPSCYLDPMGEGSDSYSIVLPHLNFEFDANATLTRVSL